MKFLARNSGEIIQTKWKLFRHGRSSASSLFEVAFLLTVSLCLVALMSSLLLFFFTLHRRSPPGRRYELTTMVTIRKTGRTGRCWSVPASHCTISTTPPTSGCSGSIRLLCGAAESCETLPVVVGSDGANKRADQNKIGYAVCHVPHATCREPACHVPRAPRASCRVP